MGTRLSNMRTTYWKLTGRGLNDGTAEPQKIKYIALVANKQIYLFWLSESFQIPYEELIDPDVLFYCEDCSNYW